MSFALPTQPATCLDSSPRCPIDVVGLSVGRSDGIYYAGKRLAPWMTFEERLRLRDVEDRDGRRLPADEDSYRVLKQRREGESLVVRWEIMDGRPGALTTLWDVREADRDREHRRYVYLWGKHVHVDLARFSGYLLRDAMGEQRLYDEFYCAMDARVRALPDEWVLSAAEIRHLVFTLMLARMEREYTRACEEAALVGVDVAVRVTSLATNITQIKIQSPSETQSS